MIFQWILSSIVIVVTVLSFVLLCWRINVLPLKNHFPPVMIVQDLFRTGHVLVICAFTSVDGDLPASVIVPLAFFFGASFIGCYFVRFIRYVYVVGLNQALLGQRLSNWFSKHRILYKWKTLGAMWLLSVLLFMLSPLIFELAVPWDIASSSMRFCEHQYPVMYAPFFLALAVACVLLVLILKATHMAADAHYIGWSLALLSIGWFPVSVAWTVLTLLDFPYGSEEEHNIFTARQCLLLFGHLWASCVTLYLAHLTFLPEFSGLDQNAAAIMPGDGSITDTLEHQKSFSIRGSIERGSKISSADALTESRILLWKNNDPAALLARVLNDSSLRMMFRDYLAKDLCGELLLFLDAFDDFHAISQSSGCAVRRAALSSKLKEIYANFLHPSAVYALNVSEDTFDECRALLDPLCAAAPAPIVPLNRIPSIAAAALSPSSATASSTLHPSSAVPITLERLPTFATSGDIPAAALQEALPSIHLLLLHVRQEVVAQLQEPLRRWIMSSAARSILQTLSSSTPRPSAPCPPIVELHCEGCQATGGAVIACSPSAAAAVLMSSKHGSGSSTKTHRRGGSGGSVVSGQTTTLGSTSPVSAHSLESPSTSVGCSVERADVGAGHSHSSSNRSSRTAPTAAAAPAASSSSSSSCSACVCSPLRDAEADSAAAIDHPSIPPHPFCVPQSAAATCASSSSSAPLEPQGILPPA